MYEWWQLLGIAIGCLLVGFIIGQELANYVNKKKGMKGPQGPLTRICKHCFKINKWVKDK